MPLCDYHYPVACYHTTDITRYSPVLFSQATGLVQLVHDLMPAGSAEEHCVLVKHKWDHRDITSNVIVYKHLHR